MALCMARCFTARGSLFMLIRKLLFSSTLFVVGVSLGFFLKSLRARGENRIYKILGSVGLGLLFATNLQAQVPAWIEFSPSVSDNLSLLWDRFRGTEFIVCLEGQRGTTITVEDFRFPHMALSTPTTAGVRPGGGCAYRPVTNGLVQVAVLHTHPTPNGDRSACYLSRTDIISAMTDSVTRAVYPVQIVMCGPRYASWWRVSELDIRLVVIFPIAGQWVIWATK